MDKSKNIKHIVILVHPYSNMLNIAGPLEAFKRASVNIDKVGHYVDFTYQIHVVSALRNKRVDMYPGISITCESYYKDIDYPIDTLIIAGKPVEYKFRKDVLIWLKEQSLKVQRICSMCAGAFILADAGILNGKRAVTHWQLCDRMAEEYPKIKVDKAAIFVKDGNVYTSAGVAACLDLSLALIEEDLGKDFAIDVAREMVLFLKRPGNQTQFSTILESQKTDYEPIAKATEWIYNHLNENITIAKLAGIAMMSERNFSRIFVRELKTTPLKYVETIRIDQACRYLTDSHLSIEEIASMTGMKSAINLDRIFLKKFETTPFQYRKNFSSSFS